MPDMETLLEQAFTEIPFDESGRHLLEAEAVTGCVLKGDEVTVTLKLPDDEPLRRKISGMVEERCGSIPGIKTVSIKMADGASAAALAKGSTAVPEKGSADPAASQPGPHGSQPHEPQRPTSNIYLDNYDAVIAIASGKGGVGKSTVAVNVAVTLVKMGHTVSLFDSDIYGPSLPIMLGLRNTRPKIDGNSIEPIRKYGLDVLSLGNLVEEAAATIWRGPMVHQVIEQMLRDTNWPGGDFMVIDLPPGTGDAQLTMSQLCDVAGAVIVSTPQDVALLDAIKGVSMFQKVDIPIIGLVENMSSFICPHCSQETPIFSKGNAQKAAGQYNIPFLGRIPIELAIREGSDNGVPVSTLDEDSTAAQAFRSITETMLRELEALG
ncbi:MAG: Mrp/NBP35 family ATP-binding protein [SAR324 cluster bacterium]|nr:Mrp/NBP35 family ATP-binding protein [SAR324 cluster bacterium]